MSNKIKESNISDSAVTESKIADNAITSAKIAPGAVVAADVNDGSITTAKLADTAVTNAKITDGTIANAKLTNSSITINGTSIALGASGNIVAGLDWQAVKTASFTAVAGEGYFVNSSGGTVTVTLPASPSIGDFVGVVDYGGNAGTNNITIARNGSNIQGAASDRTMAQTRVSEVFVYSDATEGWVVQTTTIDPPAYISATGGTATTSGNYRIHTFTSSGCFTVSCAGNQGHTAEYLVVAGGGGGGTRAAGGAGAGGYRTNYPSPDTGGFSIAAQTYPITVGAGGTSNGPTGAEVPGNQGGDSVFSTITSAGGGGGKGGCTPYVPVAPRGNGGSGGGGGPQNQPELKLGGTGNTPPVSPPQGNPGGNSGVNYNGAGGGGASAAGADAGPSATRNGGDGSPNSITGSAVTYAGGGGGGSWPTPSGAPGGVGGAGGGGHGRPGLANPAPSNPAGPKNGTANTGGGGGGEGGGDAQLGGTGGSGIVIIRYKYQ